MNRIDQLVQIYRGRAAFNAAHPQATLPCDPDPYSAVDTQSLRMACIRIEALERVAADLLVAALMKNDVSDDLERRATDLGVLDVPDPRSP